jgi:hypothetical protein
MLIAVAFAGCAGNGADEPTTGLGGELSAGKGGIDGLLIDDIYRPIPDATILLQPIGLLATTNENGEFGFLGLEPGEYVVRVDSPDHQVIPFKTQVSAGEFSEAQISARRLIDDGSALITYEYAVFIDCSLSLLLALPFGCSTDQSGDSYREGFTADYSGYNNVTNLVIEMQATNEGRFELDIWDKDHTGDSLGMLANDVFSGDYTRIKLVNGEVNTEHADLFDNALWENDSDFDTELIVFGEFSEELGEVDPFFAGGGVGVHLAIKAKFLHSLFIGPPETDIDRYCVYC